MDLEFAQMFGAAELFVEPKAFRAWLAMAKTKAAALANPSWSLIVLHDVGHVPQLEAPEDTARAVLDWFEADGHHAVQVATHRLPEPT